MCVYIYIYTYIDMCVYIYIYIYTYISLSLSLYIYIYIHTSLQCNMYLCIYACTQVHLCRLRANAYTNDAQRPGACGSLYNAQL